MRIVTLSAILLATGCVGEIGDTQNPPTADASVTPPPSAKMGQTNYTNNVHPIMNKCSGGACHNITAVSGSLSKFYDADAAKSYNAAVMSTTLVAGFTSIAPIITKIAAGHQGVVYSAEDTNKISAWLTIEATERANDGTPPPAVDPKALLKEWSGCMTQANFDAANMPTGWGNLAASNNQKCANCHQNGAFGFVTGNGAATSALYFGAVSTQTSQLLKYFTVDTVMAKVIINTGSFLNAGVTIPNATNGNGHPRFNPTTNAGMTALQAFYTSTMAAKTAGGCGPSKLID